MDFHEYGGAVLLLIAAYTDIREMRIPNSLTVSFLAAGLLLQLIAGGWSGGWEAAMGAGAGFLPMLMLYVLRGIGAGDVKLFAALGAWVGAELVLHVMVYSILYAGCIGVAWLAVKHSFGLRLAAVMSASLAASLVDIGPNRRSWRDWIRWASSGTRFPFMLAVVPGAVTVWYVVY
ncbi:prepilin peptidase [Paenibacillus sp. GCM10023252]|uniref:A24 family peptidase n=1 Tax=Paenibacillus sp. GCM10023252 TaxID=3252649 RepID=UPI00360B6AD2